MEAPSRCAPAATLLSLALGLSGCFATPRLWHGEAASDEDFDTRAQQLRPVAVRGVERAGGDLVLWIDAEATAEALGGWEPHEQRELLRLRLSTRDSPIARLYPDLPLLDTTTLELRVIGREEPQAGAPSLDVRARCALSGSSGDPLVVAQVEDEFRRFEREREQSWLFYDLAFSEAEKRPTVTFERESVFVPALWSVTAVVGGELIASEAPHTARHLPRGLQVDLRMTSVAPPDSALALLAKVLVTPIALAVDAALVGLAVLPAALSGMVPPG